MKPILQISLDIIDLDEAISHARMALRAGVDRLEAELHSYSPKGCERSGLYGNNFPRFR
jgi:hypothetical protein